ncbi:MAG: hypothetical protein COT17_00405 [Elusimicrobia bacterium CG08_land_8_20_14_0_20_51_18]|nr:MAG: hypothetical protein COT17_00405 [Elusimicrobia bacterium CG08_land_8_20_14_0_20_51_18]
MKDNIFLKTEKKLVRFEEILLVVLVFLMIFLSFFQLVKRLFFHSGILWMDIFLRYLVLNTAMISAALVTYHRKHFAMDAVFSFIKPKWHKTLKMTSNTFVLLVSVLLIVASCKFVRDEYKYASEAFAIGDFSVKAFLLQLSMPLSFILMFFHTFMKFFRHDDKKEITDGRI